MLLLRSHSARAYKSSSIGWRYPSYRRSLTSRPDCIQEGDRAFFRFRDQEPVFTKPLRPNDKTTSRWGDISHNSLIGKQARELVATSKGLEVRVYLPTLEEYVTETPRLVTPIYPTDANLIVSLLDIHASSRNPLTESGPLLEILEAGTGHGALTLYLARAIHAANPPVSSNDRRHQRGAIIHSLDISPTHSEHARTIVEGFRRGMYINDVEFHVGDISKWIDQQVSIREQERRDSTDKTFLSHIILDLPASHTHVEKAAAALCTDGNLLVFNPSVTQINASVQLIKQRRLLLRLDRVLELGSAMTGGREWDIRAVKPRALLKAENEKKASVMAKVAENMDKEALVKDGFASITRDEEQAQATAEDDAGWEMICRPKPWTRTVGGGFLAVWKKMRDRREQSS